MLSTKVQETLRESQLARRLVGVLHSSDDMMGLHGEGAEILNPGSYPVIGYLDGEVGNVAMRLVHDGLLDFTFGGCGPNFYLFRREKKTPILSRLKGEHKLKFKPNQKIRAEVSDFLTREFPDEDLIQEVYALQFRGSTTEKYLKIFDLEMVAKHYAQELGVGVRTVDSLSGADRKISEWVKADQPFVVYDDKHGYLLAAQGNKINVLGSSRGIIVYSTKERNEYHSGLTLVSPINPYEEPYLKGLIEKYDAPSGQRFTSAADIKKVGLRYEVPRHIATKICGDKTWLAHQFRA